jgi:hypothetical protein
VASLIGTAFSSAPPVLAQRSVPNWVAYAFARAGVWKEIVALALAKQPFEDIACRE